MNLLSAVVVGAQHLVSAGGSPRLIDMLSCTCFVSQMIRVFFILLMTKILKRKRSFFISRNIYGRLKKGGPPVAGSFFRRIRLRDRPGPILLRTVHNSLWSPTIPFEKKNNKRTGRQILTKMAHDSQCALHFSRLIFLLFLQFLFKLPNAHGFCSI
jgi:hypothetical protein